MIANANNCQKFADFVQRLHKKHEAQLQKDEARSPSKDPAAQVAQIQARYNQISDAFQQLAITVCDWMLEEIFTDLKQHIEDLFTKKWMANSIIVDTICITVEDYCQDFVHLRDIYFDALLAKAQTRVAKEYYKALFAKKIMFKNYEERSPAAEKITRESDQLSQLFKKLLRKGQQNSPFDALPALAEFLKLRDTSMMSLEVTGFVNNYPDVKIDQLVNVLMMRGDLGRGDAKQMVVDCLGEDYDSKPKNKKTIFS